MTPKINRPNPPYMQVTDHFRRLIQDGDLVEGAKLPTVATIAKEWEIAHATAAKAVSQLQVEGLILSSPRGSFVAGRSSKAVSPADRFLRLRRTGSSSGRDEWHRIMAADVTTAPTYVAELFGLDEEETEVIRRECVSGEKGASMPCSLAVTWYPKYLKDTVPDLLEKHPSHAGTLLAQVEEAAGPLTKGRDFYHARAADQREAHMLGLPIGIAILASAWLVWTEDGRLIEYGEICYPPRHTVSYPYDISAQELSHRP
jgi:GntR family transcriptional regulator